MSVALPIEVAAQGWWYLGNLRYLLHESQRTAYDATKRWKAENPNEAGPFIWKNHRGWGKSFALVAMGVERCLEKPFQEVRYATPGDEQGMEIVNHQLYPLLQHCPEELRPKKREATWTFRNPKWGNSEAYSTFRVVGCRENAQKHRGKRSNMVLIDECRDIPQFDYVAVDVFAFHFTTMEEPLMIMSSTPPDTPTHLFTSRFIPEAMAENRFFQCTVNDNPDFTPRDYEMLTKICGGTDTVSWKREALCQNVADESGLIVPEYKDVREDIFVPGWRRPEYFIPRVWIDVGWRDCTALVFGYHDFENDLLIAERELVSPYLTHLTIVEEARKIERELWKDTHYYEMGRVTRHADAKVHEIQSISKDHRYSMRPIDRQGYSTDDAINKLRRAIDQKKIRILQSCKVLDYQLLNGVYNSNRTDFERTDDMGHWDCGMALTYGNRMTNWRLNPFQGVEHLPVDWHKPIRPLEQPEEREARQSNISRKSIPITNNRVVYYKGNARPGSPRRFKPFRRSKR